MKIFNSLLKKQEAVIDKHRELICKIRALDKENVDSSNLIIYEAIKNWSIAEKGKAKGFCLKDTCKAKVKKLLSIFHASKNNKYTE